MGTLFYGDSTFEIAIDDRSLIHLQTVIGAKLRRGESMFFTWRDDPAMGDGRSSIWISRDIPLKFHFDSSVRTELNREWIETLVRSANSSAGLFFSDEPSENATITPRPQSSVVVGQKTRHPVVPHGRPTNTATLTPTRVLSD